MASQLDLIRTHFQSRLKNIQVATISREDKTLEEARLRILQQSHKSNISMITICGADTSLSEQEYIEIFETRDRSCLLLPASEQNVSLETSFAQTVEWLIQRITEFAPCTDPDMAVILPHSGLGPADVEQLKELLYYFGYRVKAFPDLSLIPEGSSIQEHHPAKAPDIHAIKNLSHASLMITIGNSMLRAGSLLKEKALPHSTLLQLDGLMGLESTDHLYRSLTSLRGKVRLHNQEKWRNRYIKMLESTSSTIQKARILIEGDTDYIQGLSRILMEADAKFTLSDTEPYDLKIGPDVNVHRDRLHISRGFPLHRDAGRNFRSDILYEGGTMFLAELSNTIQQM
jgi:nitrogenase molybdenum-iron protein alpha/beta subunit